MSVRAEAVGVDDVVSETFLVAWRRASSVPDPALPWLLGVASKVLANQRRTSARAQTLTDRVREVAVTQPPGIEEDLKRLAQRDALLTALGTLSGGDRELVLLHVWDGLRPREIADVLGVSPVAARARLSRASRRLQRALRGTLAGESPDLSPTTTAAATATLKRTF